jgi:hypothetical protein
MKIHQLWPTMILTDQLKQLSEQENEELADIAQRYVVEKMIHYDTGFKHAIPNNLLLNYKSPALLKYYRLLEQYFWKYCKEIIQVGPADITTPVMHMFGNVERRGQWSPPHAHMGNQIVITYYPKVVVDPDEPNAFAGQMVFHNPRNPPSGYWARKEFLFSPIGNKTGTIVCFPGHSEHSTFPFFCEGSIKYALVCNIRFSGILEGEKSSLQYQNFQQLKKAQSEV